MFVSKKGTGRNEKMESVSINSYAKINLGLDVTGLLPNGYHTVKMVMQNISLCDSLHFKTIKPQKIMLKTNVPYLPVNENNIVYAAIKCYKEKFGIDTGIMADIVKRIPVSAGMAGGSGNAAATLLAMNKMFGNRASKEELQQMGVSLGADVPYCLMGGTALAEGIGEILTPLPKPPVAKILIVKPNISVSTKMVYSELKLDETLVHPDIDGIIECIRQKDLKGMCDRLGNVLEDVTVKLYPVIEDIKREMLENGAEGALMSGSGPTVFGLFREKETAEQLYYKFKKGKYASSTFLCDFV